MLNKLIELFTTVTGPARTDARFEAARLARRADIAFDLYGQEVFRSLAREALLMREVVMDWARCSDDQLKVIKQMLIAMGGKLNQLEAAYEQQKIPHSPEDLRIVDDEDGAFAERYREWLESGQTSYVVIQ